MSGNKSSFIRQSCVLVNRNFTIYFNNKRTLIMDLLIPLFTMLIVSLVACPNMYVENSNQYIKINNGFPILSWQTNSDEEPNIWDGNTSQAPQLYTTEIDGEDYYVVNSISDLTAAIALGGEWLSANYCLGKDIDLANHEWIPIGKSIDSPFTGTFCGNQHVIYNLKISNQKGNVGFFGNTKDAKIKDLGFCGVCVDNSADNIGCIVGMSEATEVKNCFVSNAVIINSQTSCYGGLIGKSDNKSKIDTCYFRGKFQNSLDGECVNLIMGEKYPENIVNTYGEGKISDSHYSCIFNGEIHNIPTNLLKEQASIISEDGMGFRVDRSIADRGSTQIGLFMIVCVALFVGICNSIQEIVKERSILKREYMSNLRLGAYVFSKLINQAAICAVQSLIITVVFYISVGSKYYPSSGAVTAAVQIDFFITVFFVTLAADCTALFISSVVKSAVLANTFIPIVLIVQIIFSGVLFKLGNAGDLFANLMISKWGVGALSAISRLNESRPKILIDNPQYEQALGLDLFTIKDINVCSNVNVLIIWAILVAFCVLFIVACRIVLTNIKKDKR